MKNDKNSYLVVGDIYKSFAIGINVLTESECIDRLSSNELDIRILFLGQGLSDFSKKRILSLADSNDIESVVNASERASCHLTHKSASGNILISCPFDLGGRTYKFQLIVDNCFDRLSDHVTGKHIGAMVLIEAARQAGIATLQIEYPLTEDGVPWGFVLQKLNTEYSDYAFPVPTDIFVELAQADVAKNGRQISISLSVGIYQNSSCISQMTMDVQLIDKETLNKLEGMKSKKVSAASMSQVELVNRGKLVGVT